MQNKGFINFGQHQHTEFWKSKDAKNPQKGYGTQVAKAWYWYDKWLEEVEKHCIQSGNKYK